jgi:hypothetical protein
MQKATMLVELHTKQLQTVHAGEVSIVKTNLICLAAAIFDAVVNASGTTRSSIHFKSRIVNAWPEGRIWPANELCCPRFFLVLCHHYDRVSRYGRNLC